MKSKSLYEMAADMTIHKENPTRSKKYMAWLKTQNCVQCGMPADDPHHIIDCGLGGGVKASDLHAIPMCRPHHRLLHHDVGLWEELHGRQEHHVLKTQKAAEAAGVLKI